MASLIQESDGRRRIQFSDAKGKRPSIGLGSISERNARRIKDKVEQLVEHSITGIALDPEVSRWVAGLDDRLHRKLVKVGLAESRQVEAVEPADESKAVTLGEFLDDYVDKRTDVKKGTLTFYGHTKRNLIAYFGSDKPLAEITEGDADDFRRFLKREKLSDATVNRRSGLAKTFFRAAVRHRLIAVNPFQDLKATSKANDKRQRFIDRETVDRIIKAAPDAEWRLIIALARYGGLRIPSEALSLRWCDVDHERQRIRITSPKTEHHEGRDSREIPIFPELVEPLRDAWEQSDHGNPSDYVISRHRPASVIDSAGNWRNANLRTPFQKIIRKAGIEPWPKLFQNLRSTRETELAGEHPLHIVCAWIGNTERIAAKHYLQVTDEHFAAATKSATDRTGREKTVRKPVQSGPVSARTRPHGEKCETLKTPANKQKRSRAGTRDRSGWAILDSNQ
ncbi:tyrosine-type recombinase/integrase [bacterium]|nr:tyrosine-type recombinase/integrase [bacterium]